MTGLELLAFFGGCLVLAAVTTASCVHVGERRKREFLAAVRSFMDEVHDVESGDVDHPLSFRVGNIRARAVIRGDTELWQLERVDEAITSSPIAVAQRDWRAPDVRTLASVGALTPRLELFAGDLALGHGLLARARADLCRVLGRRARRCVVGPGRAFLEVTRRGLRLEEFEDGVARLDGLLTIVAGGTPRILEEPRPADRAIAGPSGALVPGLG